MKIRVKGKIIGRKYGLPDDIYDYLLKDWFAFSEQVRLTDVEIYEKFGYKVIERDLEVIETWLFIEIESVQMLNDLVIVLDAKADLQLLPGCLYIT